VLFRSDGQFIDLSSKVIEWSAEPRFSFSINLILV